MARRSRFDRTAVQFAQAPGALLDEVPPSVRQALAAAPDARAAYALVEEYGGLADADAMRLLVRDRTAATRYGGVSTGEAWPGA